MQHSGHIGKIVVRPPSAHAIAAPGLPFEANPAGTHLITGGFGGFGLETAKWLVDARGAAPRPRRPQWSGDRRGEDRGRGLRRRAACRCSPNPATSAISRSARPPVREDRRDDAAARRRAPCRDGARRRAPRQSRRAIASTRVLAPKVKGIDNLDAATRDVPLDYFVLFSSATTLIGNPGQAQLRRRQRLHGGRGAPPRRRRAAGARDRLGADHRCRRARAQSERLRSRFQKLTGVHGMRAREALDLMGQALGAPGGRMPRGDDDLAVGRLVQRRPARGAQVADLCELRARSPRRRRGGDPARSRCNRPERRHRRRAAQARPTSSSGSSPACSMPARTRSAAIRPLSEIGLDSLMAARVRHESRGDFRHPRVADELRRRAHGREPRQRGDLATRSHGPRRGYDGPRLRRPAS